MKSKLFQKLASMPGINLFNWRTKISRTAPPERIEPKQTDSEGRLYRLSHKYFTALVVQDKYIKTVEGLLDAVDFETEKWDMIQAQHEEQIMAIQNECNARIGLIQQECNEVIAKSQLGQLKNRISQLEAQIKRRDHRISDLEKLQKKAVLSDTKADRLIMHFERISAAMSGNRKGDAGRIRELVSTLTSLLRKVQTKIGPDTDVPGPEPQ